MKTKSSEILTHHNKKPEYSFPLIPQSFFEIKQNLSNKCPFKSWLFMLLGLIISPFIAFFSIMLFAIPLYATVFLMLGAFLFAPGILGWIMLLLISYLVIIILSICYPITIGLTVGYTESSFARIGKCRNPVVGAIMGGVAGFLSGLFIIGLIGIFNVDPNMPHNVFYVFGVLGVLFAIGGSLGGYWGIRQGAYCEECNSWYGKWSREIRYSISAIEPFAAVMNEIVSENPISQNGHKGNGYEFNPLPGTQGSAFIIQFRKCTRCTNANVQLHAYLLQETGYQNSKYIYFISNGLLFPLKVVASENYILSLLTSRYKIFKLLPKLLKTGVKHVEWFNIMLPAEVSHKLEQRINTTLPTK